MWCVWDSERRASVLFYSWYNSALLITLTLSLTSCSNGDLLGLVNALRVCQGRVRSATFLFVLILFFFFSMEEKKRILMLLSHTFQFLFTSAVLVQSEESIDLLEKKTKFFILDFSPNTSAGMNQRFCWLVLSKYRAFRVKYHLIYLFIFLKTKSSGSAVTPSSVSFPPLLSCPVCPPVWFPVRPTDYFVHLSSLIFCLRRCLCAAVSVFLFVLKIHVIWNFVVRVFFTPVFVKLQNTKK